jgi:hypothetical protein
MSKRATPAKQSASWWLGGEEQCPHCHQLYAYEIEVRCPVCDEPGCPHCVKQHVERGILCISCSKGCEDLEETARG